MSRAPVSWVRGEQIGVIGKDDQGDSIPRAGGDKVAYLLAHRGKPVRLLSVIQHVLGAHAVGEIHRQDEVSSCSGSE